MTVERYLLRKEVTGLRIPRGLDRPDVDLYQDDSGLNFSYREQTPGGRIGLDGNIGMERRYTNLPPGFSIRADVPMSPWDCARNPGSDACRVPEVRPSPFQTDADYYVSGCQICVKLTQTVGVFQFSVTLCHTRPECVEEPPPRPPRIKLIPWDLINKIIDELPDGCGVTFVFGNTRKADISNFGYELLENKPGVEADWFFPSNAWYDEDEYGNRFLVCLELWLRQFFDENGEIVSSSSGYVKFQEDVRVANVDVSKGFGITAYRCYLSGGFNFEASSIQDALYRVYNNFGEYNWGLEGLIYNCPEGDKYWPTKDDYDYIDYYPPLPPPPPREREEDDDMPCCGCDCGTIALIQARNTRIILNAIGDLSLIKKIHDGLGIQQLPYYVPDSYLPNSNYTGITTFKEMWSVMHNAANALGTELYTKLGLDKYPYENMPVSFYESESASTTSILDQATFNQLIYINLIDYFKKAYKHQGIGEYPVNVPANLLVPIDSLGELQTKEIKNLPEYITYIVTQLYDVLGGGSFPAEITIEDADLVQEGNQPKKSTIPNLAEAILQILANSMMLQSDSAALINITTSTLLEAGMTKKLASQIDRTTKANAEFLDYDVKEIEEELPLTFTPGANQLDKFLKDSKDKVKYWENIDQTTLSDAINKINEIAAVVNGALRRPINPRGDVKQQIIDLIKGMAALADGKLNFGTEEEATDDFSAFTERVERGFTDAPGITDPNSYYGRSYEERPRIRDIGDHSSSGDDSNG